MEKKEAMKILKEFRDKSALFSIRTALDTVIPELAESKDEIIRKEILNVFKQLDKDSTICGRNYDYANWVAWLEKQGEQNPAWSEEDEEIIDRIYNFIWKNRKGDTSEIYQQEKDANWLKSLKERVQPQPKQEWSEEDENMLNSIIATCKLAEQDRDSSPARHLFKMQVNWLKSIKERMKGE